MNKNNLVLILILLAGFALACNFNLGNTPESSSATKPNTTNSSTTTEKPKDLTTSTKPTDAKSEIKTEALNFEGSDQGNVSKTIPANGTMLFTFEGQKGATAIVNVTEETNKLTVIFNEDPNQKADTEIELNKDVYRKINRTGKYTIEVVNDTANAINFDLVVSFGMDNSDDSSAGGNVGGNVERIRLAKGEQVAVISGTLGGNESKKYVAYVIKGNMICIVPGDGLSANIRAKLNGKEFDFRDSTCTDHLTNTKDHTIEIYNSGSGNTAYNFDVGFSDHG